MKSLTLLRAAGVVLTVAAAIVCLLWMAVRIDSGDFGSVDRRFRVITSQLRAPGDENTMTVSASTSQTAQHMKYEINQDITQGLSNREIIEAMVKEYGSQVYASPPMTGFGAVVWVIPLAMVGVGILVYTRIVVRWRERPAGGTANESAVTESQPLDSMVEVEAATAGPMNPRLREFL